MIDCEDDFDRDDSQDRSAKRRGLVAHTTRPGKPESVEGEVKPLEDRMRSAESYYHPRDVEDGLSRNGGPEVGDSADPEPAEEEKTQERDKDYAALKEESPKVIRTPRQPTPKEREAHEATHIPP